MDCIFNSQHTHIFLHFEENWPYKGEISDIVEKVFFIYLYYTSPNAYSDRARLS